MATTRINPETGVIEEFHWPCWEPAEPMTRINPETGMVEEYIWPVWQPKDK